MMWLVSSQLALGLHSDGSLGDGSLGMVYDPAGEVPAGSDLVLPGKAWEVWSLHHSEGSWTALGTEGPGAELVWTELSGPDVQAWEGVTSGEELDLRWLVEVPVEGSGALMRLQIEAHTELAEVQVMRAIDVDVDADFGSYATDNGAEAGLAWAASQVSEKTLTLYAPEGQAGICSSWCDSPYEVEVGSVGELAGDKVVGAFVDLGSVAEGELVEVSFAYGLGLGLPEAQGEAMRVLELDLDGDGVSEDEDCAPYDASVHPDAVELPDGLDQDCDGDIDEDTVLSDDDGDGLSESEGDCDDADAAVQDCPEGQAWEDQGLSWTETETADCSHAPAAGGLLLALFGLLARRRR